MADIRTKPGAGRGYVVWHPVSLPEGYHALPGGKPGRLGRGSGGDVAPGAARGQAAPGWRDATPHPACKINPLGPSLGREASGSSEKPGEVAKAFLWRSRRILPLAQVTICGKDELAYKPDPGWTAARSSELVPPATSQQEFSTFIGCRIG
jgi:hypothetical protein